MVGLRRENIFSTLTTIAERYSPHAYKREGMKSSEIRKVRVTPSRRERRSLCTREMGFLGRGTRNSSVGTKYHSEWQIPLFVMVYVNSASSCFLVENSVSQEFSHR